MILLSIIALDQQKKDYSWNIISILKIEKKKNCGYIPSAFPGCIIDKFVLRHGFQVFILCFSYGYSLKTRLLRNDRKCKWNYMLLVKNSNKGLITAKMGKSDASRENRRATCALSTSKWHRCLLARWIRLAQICVTKNTPTDWTHPNHISALLFYTFNPELISLGYLNYNCDHPQLEIGMGVVLP